LLFSSVCVACECVCLFVMYIHMSLIDAHMHALTHTKWKNCTKSSVKAKHYITVVMPFRYPCFLHPCHWLPTISVASSIQLFCIMQWPSHKYIIRKCIALVKSMLISEGAYLGGDTQEITKNCHVYYMWGIYSPQKNNNFRSSEMMF